MGRFLCFSLAFLFLANVIPSKAQKAEAEETRVTVAEGAPLALECRLRPEQRAEWRRDGGALPADLRAEPERAAPDGRMAARLRGAAAAPRHAGLYTCSAERDQRVRLLVQPAGEAATTPAAAAAGEGGRAGPGGGGEEGPAAVEVVYDVRGNLSLLCTLPNDQGLEYIWRKNGTLVEEVVELHERYKLERGRTELRLARAAEDDFGNYSCALPPPGGAEQRWTVRGRPHFKLPPNTNVVEGQKLKLVCKVIGKPYPTVKWLFSNESGNFTDVSELLGERAQLSASEQGVPGGALVLAAAQRGDAGQYMCTAEGAAGNDTTVLRVKDMYAALWPFLGICAEVFILCAIILVYEKRRTKPELDDSDTDNHDQKKS